MCFTSQFLSIHHLPSEGAVFTPRKGIQKAFLNSTNRIFLQISPITQIHDKALYKPCGISYISILEFWTQKMCVVDHMFSNCHIFLSKRSNLGIFHCQISPITQIENRLLFKPSVSAIFPFLGNGSFPCVLCLHYISICGFLADISLSKLYRQISPITKIHEIALYIPSVSTRFYSIIWQWNVFLAPFSTILTIYLYSISLIAFSNPQHYWVSN